MSKPLVHVKDWRTGEGVTIRPDSTRTVGWAVALVLAVQTARLAPQE